MNTTELNQNVIEIAISKNTLFSEIDFRNSPAFDFLMSNFTSEERKNFQNSYTYKLSIGIIKNIIVSTSLENDKNYIVAKTPSINDIASREDGLAFYAVSLYLDQKEKSCDIPLFKKIYKSTKNSLNRKDSHIEITEDDIKNLCEVAELMKDNSMGKYVQ